MKSLVVHIVPSDVCWAKVDAKKGIRVPSIVSRRRCDMSTVLNRLSSKQLCTATRNVGFQSHSSQAVRVMKEGSLGQGYFEELGFTIRRCASAGSVPRTVTRYSMLRKSKHMLNGTLTGNATSTYLASDASLRFSFAKAFWHSSHVCARSCGETVLILILKEALTGR